MSIGNYVFFTILFLSLATSAFAQTAGITGTVKDRTGAVLIGAMITAQNLGTNREHSFVTDERGDYNITLLPVGAYRIRAELPGFKTGVTGSIHLSVNERLRIDFTLLVGDVVEQLLVLASAPLVQSETPSVGNVIDNQKVVELPLNGRQAESLMQLVPGVVSVGAYRLGDPAAFSAAGNRTEANNFVP